MAAITWKGAKMHSVELQRILPLNDRQLEALPQSSSKNRPVVFKVEGQVVNICTGWCERRRAIVHPIYEDRPREFIRAVMKGLRENNPGRKVQAFYHNT